MPVRFALNRMSAPHMPVREFAAMAQRLGVSAIEIRNDLAGVEIGDGTPAATLGALAREHGLVIRSINALQRFDQFDEERAAEAQTLMVYAAGCGAQALVLCPTNSLQDTRSPVQHHADLVSALARLAPMLADHGLTGLVEPLGFAECAVRRKSQAVRAIRELPGNPPIALVHDTFHHHLAGEDLFFAKRTGLVHVSGVEDTRLDVADLRDGHRVLVGAADRLDNVGQLQGLLSAGYAGYLSFEPFADDIARAQDIEQRLGTSMRYLREALRGPVAAA